MKTILTLTALSLVVAACGEKSRDPLKEYGSFDNYVPLAPQKFEKQSHAICGSEVITEKLVVTEGQKSQVEMTVKGPDANRVRSFVLVEPIDGASLALNGSAKKVNEDKVETANLNETLFEQKYTLSMTAKRGLVPYGQPAKEISGAVAPKNQLNAANSCRTPVAIEIQKIKGIPAIKNVAAAKSFKFDDIQDVELTISVEADLVSQLSDLSLILGFDKARQSKENPITNLNTFKIEKSDALAVADKSYQFKVKISGEELKAAVEKLSSQNKRKSFFDFHMSFTVLNSKTKEKSLTHDYILRIERKPNEVVAPAQPQAEKQPEASAQPAAANSGEKK